MGAKHALQRTHLQKMQELTALQEQLRKTEEELAHATRQSEQLTKTLEQERATQTRALESQAKGAEEARHRVEELEGEQARLSHAIREKDERIQCLMSQSEALERERKGQADLATAEMGAKHALQRTHLGVSLEIEQIREQRNRLMGEVEQLNLLVEQYRGDIEAFEDVEANYQSEISELERVNGRIRHDVLAAWTKHEPLFRRITGQSQNVDSYSGEEPSFTMSHDQDFTGNVDAGSELLTTPKTPSDHDLDTDIQDLRRENSELRLRLQSAQNAWKKYEPLFRKASEASRKLDSDQEEALESSQRSHSPELTLDIGATSRPRLTTPKTPVGIDFDAAFSPVSSTREFSFDDL